MIALLSVHNKELIDVLANGLKRNGYDIICTIGTYEHLKERGIETKMTSEITGFTELLDGRIKTLHPDIHHHIAKGKIDMLAVNLIPLGTKDGPPLDSMDIGGVSLIRSGVKNWREVCVLTDPADYHKVIEDLRREGIGEDTKLQCAIKAIKTVMTYDWNVLDALKNLKL